MNLNASIIRENWQRIFIMGASGLAVLIAARFIVSGFYFPFLFLLFSAGSLFLFFKYREAFILLVLIINEEFFYLVPRDPSGIYQYQGLLYVILCLTAVWYFLRRNKEVKTQFKAVVLLLPLFVFIGALNSSFQGQPIILGLKGGKGYFLILFYFAFIEKRINTSKLYLFIILAGLSLAVLNNMQYVFYGKLNIFHVSIAWERAGQARFLIGDFFTIFSPLVALSEYLKKKKRIFLFVYAYLVITVSIQGMTRTVIFGILATTLSMVLLFRRPNVFKALLVSISILLVSLLALPLIQSTFLGDLYNMTKDEISAGQQNVRFGAYDYYYNEIKKSPIIGRGVWNDAFDIYMGDNPENVKYRGWHLADIGITSLVFHFGLLGLAWLIWLLIKVYRFSFSTGFKIKSNIDPCLIGYFIFSLLTIITLNSFVHHRTIIYLTLVLSLLSQAEQTMQNDGGQQ